MVMGELPVETEVLVIGGGPGGSAAACRAADLGLDVTLVTDEPRLGWVCLLRGCIPLGNSGGGRPPPPGEHHAQPGTASIAPGGVACGPKKIMQG